MWQLAPPPGREAHAWNALVIGLPINSFNSMWREVSWPKKLKRSALRPFAFLLKPEVAFFLEPQVSTYEGMLIGPQLSWRCLRLKCLRDGEPAERSLESHSWTPDKVVARVGGFIISARSLTQLFPLSKPHDRTLQHLWVTEASKL